MRRTPFATMTTAPRAGRRLAWASVLATALIAGPAGAAVISLEPVKDNTLYESAAGNVSNGSGSELFAGLTLEPRIRRALLAFDIAGSIPAGSTINSVTLRLFMSRTIAGASPMGLHRVTADWGEGASDATGQEGTGAPAAPGDATWLHTFFSSGFWTTPGGDFAGAASASAIVGGVGFYVWGSTAQMVADVQGWLDAPTGNFGWMLRGAESTAPSAKRFHSRNHPTGNRPLITIDFSPPVTPARTTTWSAIKSLYR